MILVQDLVYSYPKSSTPTVRGVNFSVSEGEIFGFLGPSGAGKSTTQKIMTRLLRGYQGNILISKDRESKELRKWKNEYYNHIGVGFELPNHYSKLSALENLQFFATFYDVPIQNPMDLLEKVGLAKDAKKKVGNFSKGMKMRLNFVRALLHNPSIFFFDEPTSGLDPTNGKILKDIILDLKEQGKTIILTTHHMNDADQLCDRVAFMIDGELPLIDSPKNLRQKYGKRTLQIEYSSQGNSSLGKSEFDLDSLSENSTFQNILRTKQIHSMHSQEATLEDIFITVTGKTLTTY